MTNLKTIVLSISLFSFMGIFTACGGTSEITASQVKDEEDLREFVLAARDHLENDYEQAIVDFRREDGPWRHGGVYLFILDERGRVHFHAEIPALEGQEDLRIVDLDTGELIAEQLLKEGFRRGGGFVEYRFDNPATQRKERARKVNYVVSFKRGRGEPEFIVVAGFFPDEDDR